MATSNDPAAPELRPCWRSYRQKYPEDVRIAYRHFPLSSHDKAALAAQAAEAAGKRRSFGKSTTCFLKSEQIGCHLDLKHFKTWLLKEAASLGLDVEQV